MSKNYIHNVTSFRPLHDQVFVTEMEFGARQTQAGIIIPDDDMSPQGIHPRWAKVYAVGPEVYEEDVKPGDWVLVKHGRWTNHIDMETTKGNVRMWRVDYPGGVELVADDCPLKTHKANLTVVK